MLVIGLVGGMEKTRQAVAAQTADVSKDNVATYPQSADVKRSFRVDELRQFIGVTHNKGKALILPHILTLAEADYIREIGGYIWHLWGSKSCVIPIVWGDLMVTPKVGGDREYLQYLDANEAFHQTALAHSARPAVA